MSTPTHVFGQGARDYRDSHGWTDAVIIEGMSLNYALGADGKTPATERRIVITPGTYKDADGFQAGLGTRRYSRLIGAEEERPVLVGAVVSASRLRSFEVSGFECVNNPITPGTTANDGPAEFTVRDCYLHSWTQNRNGIALGEEQDTDPCTINIYNNVFDGVGSPSNLRHTIYVGSRAGSILNAEDNHFIGSRACSQLKSKCNQNFVRRNIFETKCTTSDFTAHSMIDIPACSRVIVTDCEFLVWRGNRNQIPPGKNGLVTPPIHWRIRETLDGSDIPAYPRSQLYPEWMKKPGFLRYVAVLSPGNGWSPDWQTWLDPEFWEEVAGYDIEDPANPFTFLFQKFVSGNRFRYQEGNVETKPAIRDDGTWCIGEYAQGTGIRVGLPIPVDFRERSVTFMAGNTLEGEWLPPDLESDPDMSGTLPNGEPKACPGYRDKSQPYHYPKVVEVPLVERCEYDYPAWFSR